MLAPSRTREDRLQSEETSPLPLLALVVVLWGLIVVFHLGSALAGRSLFRPAHLGTALQYAQGSTDLLRPVIVGFSANGAPTALEFPLWQAAAGLVFKVTRSMWYGWANLVSLVLFCTSLWPFFRLAKSMGGERAAWWSLVFFLAEPLIIVMAGEATTDGFCLTVTIWFVFFADKMIRAGGFRWWIPSATFAALAAVSKAPFFMAAGLYTLFLLIIVAGWQWRSWILLASVGCVAAVFLAIWTHHTDRLSAQAEFPYMELRLSHSPAIVYWWFGDLHYRLSPGPWIKGAWRFLHATIGTLALSPLLIAGLLRRENSLARFWLLATFLVTLTFTHVVLIHWHYYLMCCPAVAILCGTTLSRCEELWIQTALWKPAFIGLAGLLLMGSALDGLITMKIAADYDQFPQQMSSIIREHTSRDDKLVVYWRTEFGVVKSCFAREEKDFMFTLLIPQAQTLPLRACAKSSVARRRCLD